MSERFALDWLRLREPADLRARSRALGRTFGALVRARAGDAPALVIDLGAGSGASFRALAPLIPGDQDWRLVERDPALLGFQSAEIAQWARGQGYRASLGSGIATVAGAGKWRAHSVPHDLARALGALPLATAHGVTASALLDLVSAPWLAALADRLAAARVPFLAALTVDGRREWRPAHEEDSFVDDAFARHQRGDKGFGPALGPDAPGAAEALFAARGCRLEPAASDWRLGARDGALLETLVDGAAQAAAEAEPGGAQAIDAWRTARHEARAEGALGLLLGHRDFLAAPST